MRVYFKRSILTDGRTDGQSNISRPLVTKHTIYLVNMIVKILNVLVVLKKLAKVDVGGKVEDAAGGLGLDLVVGKVLLEKVLHWTKLLSTVNSKETLKIYSGITLAGSQLYLSRIFSP